MLVDLLAIDLDGTLLNSNRLPEPLCIEAIFGARKAGMHIVLASGRIRPSMSFFAEPLGVLNPMICANGAHIVGIDGRDVRKRLLPVSAIDTIFEYAREAQVHLSVYTPHELIFLEQTDWGIDYAKRVRSVMPTVRPPDEARTLPVLKILLMDDPARIPTHVHAMAARLDPATCRMTESEPQYLEFMPPGVSKGSALEELVGTLGISLDRTAAIGDYLNDLEMLGLVGHSAAVANAAEATKKVAHRVVGSNDEAGVAQFIDWLLADGRE